MNGFVVGLSRALLSDESCGGAELGPEVSGPELCLPQVFLWAFQSAFWQSREQYGVVLHLAHFLRETSGGDFLQDWQADMVAVLGLLDVWLSGWCCCDSGGGENVRIWSRFQPRCYASPSGVRSGHCLLLATGDMQLAATQLSVAVGGFNWSWLHCRISGCSFRSVVSSVLTYCATCPCFLLP